MDKISVITVTYNAAATLEHAIKSVLAQTYPHVEYIIIDGESSDGTVQILEKYKQELSYCISEKDNGIYDAMNKGIAAAQGDWIYFLGADDVFYDKDVLKKAFDTPGIQEADFVYGNTRLKSNGSFFGASRTYYQLIGRNINHQAIFYKRSIFAQVGLYDLSYKVLADYDLNLRIFREESLVKKYIPLDISIFNDQGGASNIKIDNIFFRDKLSYFKEVEQLQENDPMLQQYYFYTGFVELFRDKQMKGVSKCLRAFTYGPRKIFYIAVFIKFALSYVGIGKKMKII